MARMKRDPRTKEEFLDRILRFDFDGDVRNIGAQPATIVRTGANSLQLTFPETGTTFELSVHRPREFANVKVKEVGGETRSFGGEREGIQRGQARLELTREEQAEEPVQAKRRGGRKSNAQKEAEQRQADNG
jgi:hypothetical protein